MTVEPVGDDGPLTVAMIGLGQMGGHMADHIIAAGHRVRAFDVSQAALDARVAAGAVRASSPADAASGADVIGIVVFDDAQVRGVLDGDDGVLAAVAPGAVIAVHSTVRVDSIHQFAAMADAAGARLIDAGISGGEVGARAGTLVTMVGGDDSAVGAARPALATFSKEIVQAGPLGSGMALKIARNLVGYVLMVATHEGMVLAHAAGLDMDDLAHVLRETGLDWQIYAPFEFGGPQPLAPDAPEQQRALLAHILRLGQKDLDDALALADALGVSTPVAEETRRRFEAVMRLPISTHE
jgi:3-hydroxyisobutyrate dehydrogenase